MDQLNFLELCANGDEGNIRQILSQNAVDVNYQHKINGWTALHWASKRGNKSIVQLLLDNGAQKDIKDKNGHLDVDVTKNKGIHVILGKDETAFSSEQENSVDFIPNYLQNPEFPYVNKKPNIPLDPDSHNEYVNLLIKVPTNTNIEAFRELLIPVTSFEKFKETLANELGIKVENILIILRLPDKVIISSDKDMKTLGNGQKIDIIIERNVINERNLAFVGIAVGICLLALILFRK